MVCYGIFCSGKFHVLGLVGMYVMEYICSPLNLSLSQQENTQTLGGARFKPSAAQTERSRTGKIRKTKETA